MGEHTLCCFSQVERECVTGRFTATHSVPDRFHLFLCQAMNSSRNRRSSIHHFSHCVSKLGNTLQWRPRLPWKQSGSSYCFHNRFTWCVRKELPAWSHWAFLGFPGRCNFVQSKGSLRDCSGRSRPPIEKCHYAYCEKWLNSVLFIAQLLGEACTSLSTRPPRGCV